MTAPQTRPPRDEPPADVPGSVGEVVELVKTYAKQETLGPLKGAGQLVGLWRSRRRARRPGTLDRHPRGRAVIQTEWDAADGGTWSWIPYLVGIILCVAFAALAISRINRDRLNEEPK